MTHLSKSRFVSGIQCEKKLYLDIYQPDLGEKPDAAMEARFRAGHEIGRLARELFPGGKDATPEVPREYGPSIEKTRAWLQEGEHTIYEATFSAGEAFAALDILHRKDGDLWAIEVKSSNTIKDQHHWDAAFQYYVMAMAGYRPDRMFLMHLNRDYSLEGAAPDPQGLFALTDITDDVIARQPEVELHKERLSALFDLGEPPVKEIGLHCDKPYPCPYKGNCWSHIPTPSIFDLYGIEKDKSLSLYNKGIVRLEDIPEDFHLSGFKKIQVESLLQDRPHYNHASLRNFLQKFTGPLHFFDFETINPAIPMVRGMSPYVHIPFQFSLHITHLDGTLMEHHEFLNDPAEIATAAERNVDPRASLLESMKRSFKDSGSVVVFNKTFELGRLNELELAFPNERDFLMGLRSRIVDLYDPFRSGWCYLPKTLGSFSFKSVLPAIAPHLAYDDLMIRDGATASDVYYRMVTGDIPRDDQEIKRNLLNYCRRDTEGMIPVYQYLRERI